MGGGVSLSMVPNRPEAIARELDRLAPYLPRHERDEVIGHALSSPGLRKAKPDRAAWLSLVAYARHVHSAYEDLLADGYDVASARYFCRSRIDEVLASWGSKRGLDDGD